MLMLLRDHHTFLEWSWRMSYSRIVLLTLRVLTIIISLPEYIFNNRHSFGHVPMSIMLGGAGDIWPLKISVMYRLHIVSNRCFRSCRSIWIYHCSYFYFGTERRIFAL